MQTFLPHKSFTKSAKTLDRARLGKQRVECLQIIQTLLKLPYDEQPSAIGEAGSIKDLDGRAVAWQFHPAVLMWKGYIPALYWYMRAVCEEWTARGYKDTCLNRVENLLWEKGLDAKLGTIENPPPMPPWLGKAKLHSSHRSNLLRKDPEHYRQFWPDADVDTPNLDYYWPVSKEKIEKAKEKERRKRVEEGRRRAEKLLAEREAAERASAEREAAKLAKEADAALSSGDIETLQALLAKLKAKEDTPDNENPDGENLDGENPDNENPDSENTREE